MNKQSHTVLVFPVVSLTQVRVIWEEPQMRKCLYKVARKEVCRIFSRLIIVCEWIQLPAEYL